MLQQRTYRGFTYGHECPDFPDAGMAYIYPTTEDAERLIRSLQGKPNVDGEWDINATHEAEVRDCIDEMWDLA